jgi:hypothetical protein
MNLAYDISENTHAERWVARRNGFGIEPIFYHGHRATQEGWWEVLRGPRPLTGPRNNVISGRIIDDAGFEWAARRAAEVSRERRITWNDERQNEMRNDRPANPLSRREVFDDMMKGIRLMKIAQTGLVGLWGMPRDPSALRFSEPEAEGRAMWDQIQRAVEIAKIAIYHNDKRPLTATITRTKAWADWVRHNHPGIPIVCFHSGMVKIDEGDYNRRWITRQENRALTEGCLAAGADTLSYFSNAPMTGIDIVGDPSREEMEGTHKRHLNWIKEIVAA